MQEITIKATEHSIPELMKAIEQIEGIYIEPATDTISEIKAIQKLVDMLENPEVKAVFD
ncbi:hypothetical protein [Helicobacter sp. 11S02596-1]|uniref:hypothetical protein n=1 Tax=Helicobacter sp. 11S02596-1 TaxID=1476194 RepID=UPI0015DE1825|nr:hypothetical protein [Helicobacter sp. 11S02596-1]